MTYKWEKLSKSQQDTARRISGKLWDEGTKVTVSQVAKYFDEAMAFTRGQYDREQFIALTGGLPRQVSRVNVTDADGTRTGHFEWDKIAGRWSDGDRNGYGNGSGGTGRGQAVILTSGGAWVRERWTQWSGEKDRYSYISEHTAREWLLANDYDAVITEHLGEIPEEEDKRPGRPAIGPAINVRLGDELLAMVGAYAGQRGISRAEAVRRLVQDAVTRARVNEAPLSPLDNR